MEQVNINVTKIDEVVEINATPNVTQIIVATQSGGVGGIPDAPNNSNAYVRSGLAWIVGYTKTAIDNLLNLKQNNLVSGTNIKTINSESILGSGNIVISSGATNADDITETATRVFVTPTEKTAITHSNRSILDAITESFTTALKTTYDNAVSWITTNGSNVLNHIASTSNPHSVTKAQVGLSNVDNTSDADKPISTATQTALNLKLNELLSSNVAETTTDGAVTSGTSNTYSAGVLISADKISSGNILDVVAIFRKTGVASALTIRFYINNTNDLSGSPILLATLGGINASNLQPTLQRFLRIKVKNGTGQGTEVLNTSLSVQNEYGGTFTSAVSTLAIDWTTDKFLVVALQCTNASDSARVSSIKVRR
jgi:hypothetical protein